MENLTNGNFQEQLIENESSNGSLEVESEVSFEDYIIPIKTSDLGLASTRLKEIINSVVVKQDYNATFVSAKEIYPLLKNDAMLLLEFQYLVTNFEKKPKSM